MGFSCVCYLVEGLSIDCCIRGLVYLCLVWTWSVLLLLVVSASEISYPVCFAYHSMPPRAFSSFLIWNWALSGTCKYSVG